MGKLDFGMIALIFLVFLLSTAFHEAAHAWMAWKWGDSTAKDLGRLTLNPFPHIDPIGTVVVPLLGLIGGGYLVGWASTPVDKSRMRDPRWGDLWTSAAGPLANLVLIIGSIVVFHLIFSTPLSDSLGDWHDAIGTFLRAGVYVNCILLVLNLLPIPPLDGSHIVQNLLPDSLADAYESIRPFGFFILLAISATGLLSRLIDPVLSLGLSFVAR